MYHELHVLEKIFDRRKAHSTNNVKKMGYFTGKTAFCHENLVTMAGLRTYVWTGLAKYYSPAIWNTCFRYSPLCVPVRL